MKRQILTCSLILISVINNLAQNTELTNISGKYFGQKPPGLIPVQFGVGIIDNDERVFSITFSPDGKECFYTKAISINTIMTTKEINGHWLQPSIAEFSGKNFDFEPNITPDGGKMIFGSMRSVPGVDKQNEIHQWKIEKQNGSWSDPEPMGSPFSDRFCMYASVSNDGNVYFTGDEGIYISKFLNGRYSSPEKLSDLINQLPFAAHPFIAPDESYLVFDAQPQEGSSELFISFRNKDKSWSQPKRFDHIINTEQEELCAFVTRDGKYLFFSRLSREGGDIFWIDAEIIKQMR
jgi:hypothetical protein